VESITGRQLSLINKNILNLIKQSYLNENNCSGQQQQLDLKTLISLTNQVDPTNIANNTLPIFAWLKVDPKMKWDQTKPIRLNQDNQREDDLRRLREISNYLLRFKIGDESKSGGVSSRPSGGPQKSALSSSNASSSVYPGGMYCRIENEWKQRNN